MDLVQDPELILARFCETMKSWVDWGITLRIVAKKTPIDSAGLVRLSALSVLTNKLTVTILVTED